MLKIQGRRIGVILVASCTLLILFFGLGSYSIYKFLQKKDQGGKESQELETDSESFENRKLFFIREDEENEIWISDWDGSNQKGLGIDHVYYVANGFSDRWLFYAKSNSMFAYNLLEDKIEEVKIYEDENIKGVLYAGNYPFVVSDDGKVAVYGLYYQRTICKSEEIESPTACPLTQEDIPSSVPKEGYYAYHADTKETFYLADWQSGLNLIFYNWDKDPKYLYSRVYLDDERMDEYLYYKFDLYNGERNLMFSYGIDADLKLYFIDDTILQFSYPSGNPLVVKKDGEEKIIEAKSSNVVQSRTWISPDRKKVIYVKDQGLAEDGSALNHRFVLNLDTLKTERILEARNLYTFGHENMWVNDDYFVTEVIKSSEVNPITDLILVNVRTGESKEITSSGEIALRMSNVVPE